MKRLHTLVAVVGIAAAGSAAYWYQNRPPSAVVGASRSAANGDAAPAPRGGAANGPVIVEAGKAEVVTLRDETEAVGTLRSRQGVMVRPEVSGRIAQLGFRDGQRVKRGQLLVQLDDTLQRAQLQQARAQASIARTNLQRNRELAAQNFVSQSAVDQTAAALEVAQAQVALAQAQVARMRIVAPFDGLAGIKQVATGDYVKDGADLVNIEDVTDMFVDFRLTESVLSRLKLGQQVDVQLDGLPGRRFAGRVEAVDSQLDANGRSLLVRARLGNADGVLRPGMFARARIVFAVRDNVVVVPEEALVPQAGRQYVVKLVDGPNGKVSQRIEAKLGMRVPGKVEIVEGLAGGDMVVTAGQSRLVGGDGVAVRVVDVDGAANGAAAAAPAPASPSAASAARPSV